MVVFTEIVISLFVQTEFSISDLKAPYLMQNARKDQFSGCILHWFCPYAFIFRVIWRNIHKFFDTLKQFVGNRLTKQRGCENALIYHEILTTYYRF